MQIAITGTMRLCFLYIYPPADLKDNERPTTYDSSGEWVCDLMAEITRQRSGCELYQKTSSATGEGVEELFSQAVLTIIIFLNDAV